MLLYQNPYRSNERVDDEVDLRNVNVLLKMNKARFQFGEILLDRRNHLVSLIQLTYKRGEGDKMGR